MTNITKQFLIRTISTILVCLCWFCAPISYASEKLIDTIIATVDDIPITLVEFSSRLNPKRTVTIEQLKSDQTLIKALDALILEKLLVAEAERKNIKVLEEDLNRYIEEVKNKNGLNDEQFKKVLQEEGQTLAEYKERIKTEILKSRVASASIKSTTAVTDEDVNDYIKSRLGNSSSSRKVHLKKVSLLKSDYSKDDAIALAKELLSDDEPSNFVYDLGLVIENDLGEQIKLAIRSLADNAISEPIENQSYWDFFQVLKREYGSSSNEDEELPEVDESIRAQIKQKLEQDKMQKKMEQFLDQELPNLHTIDKRV